MNNLILFGKQYNDTIMMIDDVKTGETNECCNVLHSKGGIHNFKEFAFKSWNVKYLTSGEKQAYILSNTKTSERTSFVLNKKSSKINEEELNNINNADWLHVAYVDDIECFSKINKVNISFSLDFCTDTDREKFHELMAKAEIIFDSRERKKLYKKIKIDTPLIFHDEYGVEIVKSGKVIFETNNEPLKNLNVNGAGDLFAACFLENYYSKGIFENCAFAMKSTTEKLINRRNYEKI